MSIIVVVLLIAIIYIYFQSRYYYKTNPEYTILQLNVPPKEKLEEALSQRLPTVCTGVLSKWPLILNYNKIWLETQHSQKVLRLFQQEKPNEIPTPIETKVSAFTQILNTGNVGSINYYVNNSDFIKTTEIDNIIEDHMKPFLSPLRFKTYHSFIMLPKQSTTPIQKNIYQRTFILQTEGQQYIKLFNPKFETELAQHSIYDKKGPCNPISVWNKETMKYYPNLSSTNYIDIKLSKGQILSIPPFWWYSCRTEDSYSISLIVKEKTWFSPILDIPYYGKTLLHIIGVHKSNRCTCHKSKQSHLPPTTQNTESIISPQQSSTTLRDKSSTTQKQLTTPIEQLITLPEQQKPDQYELSQDQLVPIPKTMTPHIKTSNNSSKKSEPKELTADQKLLTSLEEFDINTEMLSENNFETSLEDLLHIPPNSNARQSGQQSGQQSEHHQISQQHNKIEGSTPINKILTI